MAKPCRVVVSPQLAEVLNLEPNQDLSYREWVQILHDGGLDKLADRALVALGEVKKGAKESVELQNELEVREQRSMNEPRDAKDVAIIFRKLFNFSPFEAVAAARIFDAKAARMSKLLGISKEDYYKRYWFTSEQEGGLSQLTKQSKENNLALGVSGKGFLTPNQIQSLTKEIESQYAKNVGETLMREKDDIRTNMFDYDNPIASKTVNGVDLRIAEGLIRDGKKTYLLYANGGIIGEFNSAADAKTAVKFVEDRLVKNKQLSQTEVTEEQINKTESALKNVDLKNIIGQKIFRGQQKGMKGRWFTSSKKFAEVFANSIRGKGKVEPEIIEQTILGRVLDFPFNVTDYAKISDKLADIFGVTQQEIRDALSKTQDSLGKGDVIRIHTLLEDENFGNLLASKGIDYVKAKENLTKTEAVDTFLNVSGKTQERLIAEAYHRAKVENNNTELVKSVESLIGKQEGLSLFQTDRKESLSQMTLPDGREVTVKRMSPEVVNGFYSPIEKNLMEYGKDKIKAKDWLNVVGKGDEAVFTGVRAFLEGKDPNAMVSKQEILDYMKDNRISVVEVVKGSLSENEQAQKLYNRPYSELTDIEQMVVDGAVAKSENGTTKFSQYQLEGEKENYKEVLVTLPRGETEEGLPKGWKVIPKEEYKDAWSGSSNYLVIDEDGFSVIGGDTRKDAINAYKKFKPRTNIKDTKFQSTHFSEPDILVHLRMNTRTDADGKKVLFLEEVQSDWGQTGKKEGFKQDFDKNKVSIEWTPEYGTNVKGEKYPLKNSFTILYDGSPISGKIGGYYETNQDALNYAIKIAEKDFEKRKETKTPTAPFVMDTNAWTKLGLKVALKEAVKQGADKIAWTTGTQQFDRWGTEKIDWVKTNKGWTINIQEQFSGTAFEGMNVDEKALSEKGTTITSKEDLKAAIYRTLSREKNEAERQKLTDRIWDRMQKEDSGTSLPRKEGMESFYGTEGTKGIVGGVAEKLFGQKVGETKIGSKATYTTDDTYVATDGKAQKLYSKVGDKFLASISNETANGFSSKDLHIELVYLANKYSKQNVTISTQPSVDITPELKAQVQEGLPLFQGDRKGAWSKEAAKAKRIISMYQKADSTTQAHEVVGHDFLDEIIQLSSTNEEMAEDLNTIVDEFIKETGSKVSKEKLLKDLKDFDVEKKQNQNGKDIHEWFAESAERYFATERGAREGAGFSKKMVALFEKFRQYMADLYSKMNKELVEPSPAMKQIFRKIFGAENFAEAEEMRKATFDRMNSLQASELEMNYSKSKPKLSDIINKYKPKEGLGQLSDDFVQDMYNAASIIVKDGEATRWNVTNKLQELMPHLKSEIEQLRKVLQEVGTKGNLRGGVENLLANPYITDEIKEKIAKLSEYTPESMAKVGLNAEQILSYYIGEADNNDIVGMQTVAKLLAEGKFDGFTEKVSLRQLLIANYNQLAKITKDENKRIDYVNAAVDQAEAYAIEGTGMGRMINMYKALGSLTADGLIVWAKRQEMKFTKPSFERFKSEIKDLKKRLKKAQEDIDYFFEQVVGREETEAQYKEVIAAYQAEIDALKARKPKEPKASKSAYRNVKKQRQFNDSDLSELAKEVLASKLFQDMSNLTPAQKLAYAIMERKPTNISELAKQFSKYLGKKVDPSELRELYQQTRDFLITQDIGYAEGLSANEELEKDLQDLEDTKRAKIEELERKKAAAEAKLAEKKAAREKEKISKQAEDYQKELVTLEKTKEKLAESIFADAKNAEGLVTPKQAEYLNELLKAIKAKVTETYPNRLNKTTDPYDALRFALNALVDLDGARLFEDSKSIVEDKIDNDENLDDSQKDALRAFLNDYQNFIFDQVLSKGKASKIVQQGLKDLGYVTPQGGIDWKEILFRYRQNKGAVKNELLNYFDSSQMAGIDRQLAVRVLRALMEGYDVQLNKANERYYKKNPPAHVNLTSNKAADKLSDFVLSDLKRAMSGTLPKQKTYVEELLSALTQKAKEVALKGEKGTQKQAPITPIEAIKKALDAIQNGRPDASIWNDAVEQVKQKIEQDPDLSQQDKEDLNLYLNDYTSFVYDNMLNDSVILKAIKENLIANGYGSGNTVNFKALIVADGQAQMQERQRLIEKLKQDLSQYDPVQVEKVLDAIAERYQRLINEKRKQIADEYINQTFKTKSPSTRRAIRGTIGKLIMENRMGLFDDTNNAILDALAEKKGFTNMTSDDWAKIKEYADLVEALPLDSNLQNEALEEMTAFVRTKMPGRWLLIATAVRYGVLLGRITSNIKNAVGGFEQALTLTLARAMRGDTEFGKSALKGFGQGDFKDVLIGGGINQANRISVEADANGMPRFRVLEYLKPKTIGGKVVESVKYSGRMLDAMDAIWQKFFTSGYDIKYMRKLLQLENPNATKQEIDDMVNKIFSNDRIADYMDQATKEVIASGKKVTEAKVRRRAYEIMRDSLVRPIAKQLSDFESTEKTYKTDFLENFGVGTGVGAIALATANVSKKLIEPLVERIVKMKTKGVSDEYAKEQAKIYSSIIPNFILPFSKGLSGFIEKGLERELIYGLTKSIAVSIAAKSKNPTTIEEKMAQYRAIEKAKDIATSAVVTNLILYGIGGALYAMSKQWEDDEEKEGRYHPRAGAYGKAKPMTIKGVTVKEKAEPENVIVLFGEEIPLSYVGGLGVTAMVDANLYKAFTEETDERKKTKAMEVASNFGTASLYTMDSFLSQAWLMQASDNKSITEMIQEGNTERALNLIQNTMINYMGSYIPWSGFINQSLQGARELSGGETYQEAKTISEKIQKQFGLAGITYTNTKKNYLGEDIKYSDVNKEGIIGLVNMFKTKSISAEDNWLRNIGFKEKASGQYAKGLKDLDGYSPSIEEYDRYDDRTKSMFGIIAKEAYNQKANIVPLPDEINRVTKKPYTVDEFQSKVMRSALSAVSKYNIVRLKKERGDYNSDKDAYEQDMENAFYNLDEVADIIYYKKGDEYKNRKRKKDALIDKVTEIK